MVSGWRATSCSMTQHDYAILYRVREEALDILRVIDGKLVGDLGRAPRSRSK
jgi:hypothetical protein